MTDYSKQTVAQLRQVLKERSIPSTGLTRKQQIIEKLQEHDAAAAAENEDASATEATPVAEEPESATEPQDPSSASDNAAEPAPTTAPEQQDDALPSQPAEDATIDKVSGDVAPQTEPPVALPHHEAVQPAEATPSADGVAGHDFQEDAPAPAPAEQEYATPRPTTANTSVSQTPIPTHEQRSPTPVAEPRASTADSSRLGSPELKEDSRKRKRRSLTPPIPPEEAVRKRMKQDEDNAPVVHLHEDADAPEPKTKDAVMEEADAPVDAEAAKTVLPARTSDHVVDVTGSKAAEDLKESESEHRNDPGEGERGQQVLEEREEQRTGTRLPEESTTVRRPSTSHKTEKEGRFKSALEDATSAPAGSGPTETGSAPEDDDRPISPALHAATRGLYIRGFMRPLQLPALKKHLISLASPPSTSEPDTDVLELFHLDPIRTHVLALFNSVSAAARVRSALHGAVWPVERTRKALWADFIPDEKVGEWIDYEEKEGGGRMGKRWEVVYEPNDGDSSVRAELREVGATGPRPPVGGSGSASSPTASSAPAKKLPTGPAAEKSFLALDKLFRSTTAKPKLYFLPVEKDIAEKRLDELDRCTSRDWKPSDAAGGTERRYTFENGNVLVDAGPDAETFDGVRGRGRVQYRGAFGPGVGGGGGPGGRPRDRGWGVQHGMGGPPDPVFDLPKDIVDTLSVKEQSAAALTAAATTTAGIDGASPEKNAAAAAAADEKDGGDDDDTAPTAAVSTSCGLCGLTFASLAEQRGHVRSDLHGYNLKQKMRGAAPVGEAEFERLVGELDESISGSESSSSGGGGESDEEENAKGGGGGGGGDTTLSALLKKQARIADASGAGEAVVVAEARKRKRGAGKPPMLWFTSASLPAEVNLGVYRAILSDAEQEDGKSLAETIRKKQLPPQKTVAKREEGDEGDEGGVKLLVTPEIGPHYFLCMIGGGHFAAMIVALAPKTGKKHTGQSERQATVVAHKTFHRYTTRRKQGGSQSANDAAKGAAHSAGSSLRRYNEAALTSEVRALLSEWKDMIDTADLLFIRATGSTNRRTLYGPYDGQILRLNDPRIRGFPFSTRRATQSELMRSFVELTRVKVSRVDEAALAAAAEATAAAAAATPPRTSTPSKPSKPKPTPEEEEALLHSSQLQALIRRSKAPALVSYIQSNNLSPNFRFHPLDTDKNYHAPTPLHLAAHLNAPVLVLALLTKAKADPAVANLDEKTPFELAGDRATRDAFRIARHELGDAAADWAAARVPAGVSRAEVERASGAEKAEEAAREAERRKTETERLRREEEQRERERREKRVGKGKALGGGLTEKTAGEKREEEARGLTPEMRMRLERERRARAAEERLKRMQGGR
ncbi:ankyrin repeat and zinc finger domain-containing protein [Diplodia corticola]|uniref:Ankyrin repeat and zinc finger domain-containing protein n=1 Tax=Diplodia corticola TaxID=236234 RepID=A0A1J9QUA5_9PEZI|nr:ankyrin repeat and zinc finger domain-containing protein [Diplodia corticola]OJD31985.1 ankyrin repeat and zinc finger domain-containing protein [Diplodia corticola]